MQTITPNGIHGVCRRGLILLLALLAAACSQERATGPGESDVAGAFPALPVTEVPVVHRSDPVQATADSDTTVTFDLAFPGDVVASFSEPYDIALYVSQGRGQDRQLVQIYDYRKSVWRDLVPRVTREECPYFFSHNTFYLSWYGNDLKERFLSTANTLRVRGENELVQARLVQYHPDYAIIAFPPGYSNHPIGLASVGDRIWAAVSYYDCDPDSGFSVADSVFILDTNGVRQSAFAIPFRASVTALAEGDGVVWALYNNRNSIGTIDPVAGVVRHQFALHGRFGSPQGIVWALDRLWIHGPSTDSIHGIRIDLSIDSGFAVVDSSIELPWILADVSGCLAWDGAYFYVLYGPCLDKVDLTGISFEHHLFPFADSWPQGRQACHIAWDGATMWAFHRQSYSGTERAYALSRIRLP